MLDALKRGRFVCGVKRLAFLAVTGILEGRLLLAKLVDPSLALVGRLTLVDIGSLLVNMLSYGFKIG